MEFEFTIKNYRCFSDEHPARFTIRPGFTAFVGANNSGKSSLMRLFYELRHVFHLIPSQLNRGSLLNVIKSTYGVSFLSVQDQEQVFTNTNDRDLTIAIKSSETGPNGNPNFHPFELVITIRRADKSCSFQIITPEGPLVKNIQNFENILNLNLRIDDGVVCINDTNTVFLKPVTDLLSDLANSLYIGPFRNAVNIGSNENYYDIQVGQGFIKKWRDIKTGPFIKQNEAAFQITKDIQKIFEFEEFEINPSADDMTLQVIINGRSYKLPDLGSGLTQFILVLANAAIRQPAYTFIDEPELNLHPSLQLDFLTTLGSYARKGVIFATHNIGLARASADQIYTVRMGNRGSEVKPLESTPRLTELIGELSFSGYRELGFQTVLLVEGVTEVKTLQQFLRMLKKDHKVLLIPLGGAQLINETTETELAELTRIPANFYALIDSEKTSEEEPLETTREAFLKMCEKVGIRCHVLKRRALENYFTDAAIKQEKGNKYRALGPYESLKETNPAWAKSENWRIARRMSFVDIEKTDLGEFLQKL